MENKNKELFPINFSVKQMGQVTDHTTQKNKDGVPLKMCKVFIPDSRFRPNDFDFGVDVNGINLNERNAYINLPRNSVYFDKKNKERMFTYLDGKREYIIHFDGKPTGEATLEGKVVFDQPKPYKISAKDLAHLYSIRPERVIKKDVDKSIPNKSQDKEKSNAIER